MAIPRAGAQKTASLALDVQIETRPKHRFVQANHQLTNAWRDNIGTLLMESATLFMLLALVGGFLSGYFLSTPPKRSATVCGVTPIIVLIGIYAIRSAGKFVETIQFVSPFLVAAGILYAALGYFGSVLGNEKRIKKQEAMAGIKSSNSPKRSGWFSLAFLIALPVFFGVIDPIVLWVHRLFPHLFR